MKQRPHVFVRMMQFFSNAHPTLPGKASNARTSTGSIVAFFHLRWTKMDECIGLELGKKAEMIVDKD